jgi:preprotein translocase SecE subunit
MFTVASGSDEPRVPRPARSLPTGKKPKSLKAFFIEVNREMKKVSWPSVPETNRLFGVVMMVTLLLVGILSLFGWLFDLVINFVTKGTI